MPRGALRFVKSSSSEASGGIYLSHAAADTEAAALAGRMEAAGHSVVTTQENAAEAIAQASVFLLLLSPDCVNSAAARSELQLAASHSRRVLVAVLRRTAVPPAMEYALVGARRVDLSEDLETGASRLLELLTASPMLETVVPETALACCAAVCVGYSRLAAEFLLAFPRIMVGQLLGLLWLAGMLLPSHPRGSVRAWCERAATSRAPQLMDPGWKGRGHVLLTEYKYMERDLNGDQLRICTQWRDPISRMLYLFRGPYMPPADCAAVDAKEIAVYVDPANIRRYSMDLSFLPKSAFTPIKPKPSWRAIPARSSGTAETVSASAVREQARPATVFVSHSVEDTANAALLSARLRSASIAIVSEPLSTCAFVVILPSSSTASDSQAEDLRRAYASSIPILPVAFGESSIPLAMQFPLQGFNESIFSTISMRASRTSSQLSPPHRPRLPRGLLLPLHSDARVGS